jgi:ribosomal-protein-alanine N-acetyltransferase
VIETARLVLRELRHDDWVEARALDSDPEVVRYQSNDVLDEAGTRAYLAKNIARASETPRRVFDLALTRKGEDRFLGRAGLGIERPEHHEAMVWFQLRRDLWGQGYTTEALRGVLRFGFETLKLHRCYGDCDPRNVGSARVMEKAGMRREAHLRENWWLKGEWCDSYIYAALEHEWR